MSERLTAESEVELAIRVQAGDKKARDRFVTAFMGLAVSVARRYRGRGIPMEDLIQEASIGLVKAVDRFDPDKGVRFSTYADYWIKKAINEALHDRARVIRLPHKTSEFVASMAWVQQEMYQRNAKMPTDAELAAGLSVPVARVVEAKKLPALELESLDAPLRSESESEEPSSLAGVLADPSPAAPDGIIQAELHQKLYEVLETLSDDEQVVLRLRYGLDDGHPRTAAEVAKTLPGMTLNRVRQVEKSALARMGNPKRQDPIAVLLFGEVVA